MVVGERIGLSLIGYEPTWLPLSIPHHLSLTLVLSSRWSFSFLSCLSKHGLQNISSSFEMNLPQSRHLSVILVTLVSCNRIELFTGRVLWSSANYSAIGLQYGFIFPRLVTWVSNFITAYSHHQMSHRSINWRWGEDLNLYIPFGRPQMSGRVDWFNSSLVSLVRVWWDRNLRRIGSVTFYRRPNTDDVAVVLSPFSSVTKTGYRLSGALTIPPPQHYDYPVVSTPHDPRLHAFRRFSLTG